MERTAEKTTKQLFQPCPLYEEGFGGRCKDCGKRQECIALTVLDKLQTIESKLDTLIY
ncbi:MAG: hypothetical protein PHV74_14525 [Dehalococcoidia bacterium]|nr:hypothetical protein [Dehalococcoidia bacterium]